MGGILAGESAVPGREGGLLAPVLALPCEPGTAPALPDPRAHARPAPACACREVLNDGNCAFAAALLGSLQAMLGPGGQVVVQG